MAIVLLHVAGYPPAVTLTNRQIAELLAVHADDAAGHWQRALRKASRAAYMWEEEAATVLAAGRELTSLWRVGPKLEALLMEWLEEPPEVPEAPPARADFLSVAEARSIVADHPDWAEDLQGDLQMHTTYSDGKALPEEMAQEGRSLGYRYIAITDHSQGLKIAGGMDESRLAEQEREIAGFNRRFAGEGRDFVVLSSLEMNLSPDGSGDMDPGALARLDLVLGSFHSQLRRTEDQTGRYLKALTNPDIHVLGHPRGRIYNFRVGLQADWDRVFEEAAATGKALEIDCYPDRQDLNLELLRAANEAGCTFSLGTDAHNRREMHFMEVGLASAIAASIPKDRVLNFASADGVRGWVAEHRATA